jgi:hypothetical protein
MVVARLKKDLLQQSGKDEPLAGVSDREIARRQAARNAAAREELLAEFGALSGTEVVERASQQERMSLSSLNRWRRERKVFVVDHLGHKLFPAFQFGPDGCPRPIIAEVLAAFGEMARGWETALWFMANNGWLDGQRPVDLLDTDPAAVSEAARREVEVSF